MSREANLYKRGKTWWFRATINGTEIRESLRTSTVKSARELRDKKLKKIEQARAGIAATGWYDAVVLWTEHVTGQISHATAKRYVVSLQQCKPWLGHLELSEITGQVLSGMTKARKAAGVSITTIRRDLTAVSQVFTHAESLGLCEGNPTLSFRRTLKERRDPIELPQPEQIEEIINISSKRFGALIKAALLTGCRQDELVRVTWKQFTPEAQTLDVIGKGNKRRTLYLSNEASAHISAQSVTPGSDLIFCRESGDKFTQAASDFCHFRRTLEARARKEKQAFTRFRFHDLRHLYAVTALRQGIDIYTLSQHLGHTSVKTTEIYLAFLPPAEALRAKHGGSKAGLEVGTKVGTVTAVLKEDQNKKNR